MGSTKRKRESYATPSSNDGGETSKTPEPSYEASAPPFKIIYAKLGDLKPKKRKSSGKNRMDDHSAPKDEAGFDAADKAVTYMVTPGAMWDGMKKYKNFIVCERQFGVHDYVYVNNGQLPHGAETEDDKKFWIARVLEVRASGPTAVYLRVYWMYWPSELPAGAQPYHGKSELVASNHMEIIDATTISGKADVTHVLEKEDAPTATGLYWRQKFDFRSKKLSSLKRECTCKQFHNPDKLLLHCVNDVCGKWMHEDCVLKDAKDQAWARLTNPKAEEEVNSDTIEVNGNDDAGETIQVALRPKTNGSAKSRGAVNGSKTASGKGSAKGKSRGRKDEREPAWEGSLDAKLQMKPSAEGEEDSGEITGKVLITDLREDEEKTWEEQLSCLFCGNLL